MTNASYLHMHDGEPVVYQDYCPVYLLCPACQQYHVCGMGCTHTVTQEEIDEMKGHNND